MIKLEEEQHLPPRIGEGPHKKMHAGLLPWLLLVGRSSHCIAPLPKVTGQAVHRVHMLGVQGCCQEAGCALIRTVLRQALGAGVPNQSLLHPGM